MLIKAYFVVLIGVVPLVVGYTSRGNDGAMYSGQGANHFVSCSYADFHDKFLFTTVRTLTALNLISSIVKVLDMNTPIDVFDGSLCKSIDSVVTDFKALAPTTKNCFNSDVRYTIPVGDALQIWDKVLQKGTALFNQLKESSGKALKTFKETKRYPSVRLDEITKKSKEIDELRGDFLKFFESLIQIYLEYYKTIYKSKGGGEYESSCGDAFFQGVPKKLTDIIEEMIKAYKFLAGDTPLPADSGRRQQFDRSIEALFKTLEPNAGKALEKCFGGKFMKSEYNAVFSDFRIWKDHFKDLVTHNSKLSKGDAPKAAKDAVRALRLTLELKLVQIYCLREYIGHLCIPSSGPFSSKKELETFYGFKSKNP